MSGRYSQISLTLSLGVVVSAMAGCSSFYLPSESGQMSSGVDSTTVASDHLQEAAPLVLKVLEDAHDGTTLHVLVSVVARTDWKIEGVVVRLASLKDGEVETATTVPVVQQGDRGSTALAEGEERRLMLSVPAGNATDYQVELLWGADASSYAASTTQPLPQVDGGATEQPRAMLNPALNELPHVVAKPPVDLRGVAIARQGGLCPVAPCAAAFKISGEFYNRGTAPISEITLGVGFIRVSSGTRIDLSKELLENETPVEIVGLRLMPGAGRPFNLDVDSPVAGLLPRELQPAVRVIAAR